MALTITSDTLRDGIVNAAVLVNGYSDALGDPEPVVAVDASDLANAPRRVKVDKVAWTVSGGMVKLAWATATGSEPFLNLTGQGEMDFCHTGGAISRSDEYTGDILLSTDGFNLGSNFSVKLEMRKKY